ncbi:MAG: hypothetical protein MUF42_15730, partial [Cytophagaceae bacterium]|nr:hypothetical protein [Cytophagaceae bacterium]
MKWSKALIACLVMLWSLKMSAAVVITSPALTVYPCSTYPTPYSTLGNIVLTEAVNTDFTNSTANATLILAAPAGFEFLAGTGAATFAGGGDITAASIVVTATEITVTFTTNGNPTAPDALTISGIQIRATAAGTGKITRGGGTPAGGTAVIAGAVVGGLTYADLVAQAFPSADAGPDQLICATTTTMAAAAIVDPTITGSWTLVSGTGTITTPSSPTTTITGLALGDNIFRWTITKGSCTSNAIVTITTQAAGLGCTSLANNFSAVVNISPSYATQNTSCPPPSSSPGITEFTLSNPGPFNVGDKVLVIQMQGALVNTTNAAVETAGFDGVFGSITDYNGAGNYEYAIIATKVGSVITFSQNLVNPYNVAGRVQIVSVPQFANYTLTTNLTGTPWNPTTGTGGVLVFEVFGTLTMNGATISMDGRGFLGGGNVPLPGAPLSGAALSFGVYQDGTATARCGMGKYSSATADPSTGFRGEGIAASLSHLYGRGALANGGGSGSGWNSGAGGGANICAGGRGGYEYSSCYNNMGVNPFYVGTTPTYNAGNGLPASGLNARMHGIGGYALTATANKVFMGGGGGAANGDGGAATPGGNGGGIIIISAGTIAGSSGIISSNGQRGYANAIAPYLSTIDATGAGGAGGSILLDVATYSIGSLTVRVNGGKGGNQDQPNTCHGNGGGGGGGLIRHKGITPNVILSALGGSIGTQRPSPNTDPDTELSLPLSNDNSCAGGTTYGAMPGNSCSSSAQQTTIVVPSKGCCSPANLGTDESICGLASITLSHGTLSTTNKTFRWFRNGVLISGATGPTYNATTAGTYSVIVDSTVTGFTFCSVSDAAVISNSFPTPYLGPDQQLCDPSFLNLTSSNAAAFPGTTTWQWQKDGVNISGATTPSLNNVTAAGTYRLTATNPSPGCGPSFDEIVLTTVMPTVVNATFCGTATVNLSVSGGNGGPYEWYTASTGGSLVNTGATYSPTLSATTTYWVEDNGLYAITTGPPISQAASLGTAGNRAPGSADNQVNFNATQDFYLYGLTMNLWANTCGGNVTYSVNISNASTGYTTQTRTGTAGPCGPGLQTYVITFATPIFIPAGNNYRIDPAGSSHALGWYPGPFAYPSSYLNVFRLNSNNSADADAYPGYFDWQIRYDRNCGRVPVLATHDCPLPVNMLSFTGEITGENQGTLTWITATENDVDYFMLEKSNDGKNFMLIAEKKGSVSSTQIKKYQHQDILLPGDNLYRLTEVQTNGVKNRYEQLVLLQNTALGAIQLFP